MNSQVRVSLGIGLGLILITVAALSAVVDCDFVEFDDREYVTENPLVLGGLDVRNMKQAFVSFRACNWHPLTWLSLMIDVQLFGLNPRAFHRTNLIFHLANVLLLFIALNRMTSQPWRSGIVAALFAVHPLHVESVAWVSERKDVLSAFFWMLVLISYHWYACRPAWNRYLVVLAFYSLGLMSKSMVVTLPCVLLLLDAWPLRRVKFSFPSEKQIPTGKREVSRIDEPAARRTDGFEIPTIPLKKALVEKLPMLLLSAVVCCLTIAAQSQAIESAAHYVSAPWEDRVFNALISYFVYLEKAIWPVGLGCFYPYGANRWSVAGHFIAIAVLISLTWFAVVTRRKKPSFLVGWLWYLGTLLPVIGLIQVGEQSMADRYTYLPLIGIFIAFAWRLPEIPVRMPTIVITTAFAAVILSMLIIRCREQVATWKNTETLFRQAYEVNPKNWRAAFFMAEKFKENGQVNKAAKDYREAASLLPKNDSFQEICGCRLALIGKFADAADCFAAAVRIRPQIPDHHRHLGLMLVQLRQLDAAAKEFQETLRLKPDDAAAHNNLGAVLLDLGRLDQAEKEFREALRLNPLDQMSEANLKILTEKLRRDP